MLILGTLQPFGSPLQQAPLLLAEDMGLIQKIEGYLHYLMGALERVPAEPEQIYFRGTFAGMRVPSPSCFAGCREEPHSVLMRRGRGYCGIQDKCRAGSF